MRRKSGKPGVPLLAVMLGVLVSGCATEQVPENALRLEESTLDIRSLQTRTFAAVSEAEILAATIAVLQDMEFNIDRIEKPLGVVSASKISDADDSREKTGLFLLDMLCAAGNGYNCDNMSRAKDEQHIILTMVVLPSLERSDEYVVRITMQRIIFDKEDRVRILKRISMPEVYQEVFDNLRQALFIEVGQS